MSTLPAFTTSIVLRSFIFIPVPDVELTRFQEANESLLRVAVLITIA